VAPSLIGRPSTPRNRNPSGAVCGALVFVSVKGNGRVGEDPPAEWISTVFASRLLSRTAAPAEPTAITPPRSCNHMRRVSTHGGC